MSFQNDAITGIPAPPPTDYDRQYNFTDYQVLNPGQPMPGQQLDIEFNAIEKAIDETQARARLIQRDDGALANKSVGLDQLKNEARIGVNTPRDWMPFTRYAVNDSVIVDDGAWYVALQSHVSSGSFNDDLASGLWEELIDLTPYTAEAMHWATYPIDQTVPEGNGVDEYSAWHHRYYADQAQTTSEAARDASQTAQGLSEAARDASQAARDASQAARDAAQQAEATARTLLTDFNKRYLGRASTPPTQDLNGDPVETGALYFRDTDPIGMYVWDGSSWAPNDVNALRQELAAPSGAELVSYEGKSLKETLDAMGPVFKSIASAKLGEFPIEGQRVYVSSYYSDWAVHAPYHPAGGGEFVATAEADQEDGLNVYATATPGMFLVRTAVYRHTPQMMGLGLGRNAHEGLELSEFLQLTKRAYFPKGEYPIDAVSAPLTVPSDTDVEAHKEAKFSTLPNSFSGFTKTIAVESCSNVRWQGGVVVGERYDHTGTDGEFGHGIYIGGGASNVKFIGVESSDFWGDGWYIGNADATTITNITIEDCIGDGNRRQGLSLTSGIGVNIIRGHYRNTNGTAPSAGIDIEPNVKQDATQYVRKLLVDGVRCYGNAGGGLLVAVAAGPNGSGDGGLVEGKIVNCFSYENGKDGFFFNETSWLTVSGNHSFNNGEWGYNCSVGVTDAVISANQARNNPSGCFNLNNGCDRVTLSGNRGGGGEYLIKAYNCDELRITDCHLRNAYTALQLDQCRGYNISASSFKDCPYAGVYLSNPNTSNGMIVDNSFHNCGSHATEVVGRAYGAVVCVVAGASGNITNINRFTWDSGKAPANSIYYVRNTTTIRNKFVHDVIQDRNVTKLRTEAGPAEPNNEVADINDLFTYPL